MRRAAFIVAGLLFFGQGLEGQGLTARAADPRDVESLDAIIAAFYDVVSRPAGVRTDWARDSTLYLEGLRFRIVSPAGDGYRVRVIDHGQYAAATSDTTRGFFEREVHRETHRWGPMAQVFSTYEWTTVEGGPVEGRGINAIELFHDGTRWWIGSAMWMGETAEQPIPREYLPRR